MITEQAMRHATIFRGIPVNVCARCAKERDPDSAWQQDDDGDQLCLDCVESRCADCDSIGAGSCFRCRAD